MNVIESPFRCVFCDSNLLNLQDAENQTEISGEVIALSQELPQLELNELEQLVNLIPDRVDSTTQTDSLELEFDVTVDLKSFLTAVKRQHEVRPYKSPYKSWMRVFRQLSKVRTKLMATIHVTRALFSVADTEVRAA